MLRTRPRSNPLLALLSVAVLVAACSAPALPATRTAAGADDFAAVRATAEAAYQAGAGSLSRGDLDAALVQVDQAKLNDPDNRTDIAAALAETVRLIKALPTPPPPPTRTPIPSPTPQPTPVPGLPTPAPPSPVTGRPPLPAGFVQFADTQSRFTIAAPADWQVRRAPSVEFGEGIVAFRDPTGRADLSVALDPEARMPSPELYAARMDLAMQQVPGYALESVVPGQMAASASVRRNYVVTQRDASGRVFEARGFQVTILRGVTPYILTGSAAKADFATFDRAFAQVLETFSFR